MKLLPLATEPFTAPTDRDMLPSERREFVRTHRTCVLGHARQREGPAEKEDRVVIRCRPYATFASPPRHLHQNDRQEKLTHWVSGTVPWDSRDEGPAREP